MAGSCKRKLKKKAKELQAAAGTSPSEPPFQKLDKVLCGKKAKPCFTVAQLEFMRRHCFSCGAEFHDSKQLKSHNKDKHSNQDLNKKCSICFNMFRESGEHDLHYLKMTSCWKCFSDE